MKKVNRALFGVLIAGMTWPIQSFAEGFQVDTDKDGLRKFGNDPFFSELAVGEEAYAYVSNLCVEGNTLQLISNMKIGSLSEYGFNLKFKREVSNAVTGQIVTGSSADLSRKAGWFSDFGGLYQCSEIAALLPFEPTFLEVLSIDGFTNLKALMRSHFVK